MDNFTPESGIFETQVLLASSTINKNKVIENIVEAIKKREETITSEGTVYLLDAYIGKKYLDGLDKSNITFPYNIFEEFQKNPKIIKKTLENLQVFNKLKIDQINVYLIQDKFKKHTFSDEPLLRDAYFSTMGHLQNIKMIATGDEVSFFTYKKMKKELEQMLLSLHKISPSTTAEKEVTELNERIKQYKEFRKYLPIDIWRGKFEHLTLDIELKKEQRKTIATQAITTEKQLLNETNLYRNLKNNQPDDQNLWNNVDNSGAFFF